MRRTLVLIALAALAPVSLALAAGQATVRAASPPVASTGAATAVTASGATLNGTVNPGGDATVYSFQWGPTSGYGRETPLPPASAGSWCWCCGAGRP